jgi:hypothetical protein
MLDLLVPDLLAPADAPAALREVRLPHLERWLVRAEIERGSAKGAIEALASAYALEHPAPVAALSLVGEEAGVAPREGPWVRADPVHLRVDRDRVTLHDASILAIEPDEARALADALATLFTPDLRLHVAAPDRWYASVAPGELPRTTALERVHGRDVFGLLPESHGKVRWSALLTEAQMVLSTHAVNRAREAAGRPAINSVWFWGEGITPASLARPYSEVHATDVFARGLARLSGAPVRPLPERLRALDVPGGHGLAVVSSLAAPLARNDVDAWIAAARRLDESWFADLGEVVDRFERVRLVLPSEKGSVLATITPRSKLRWYRRAKPLSHHA